MTRPRTRLWFPLFAAAVLTVCAALPSSADDQASWPETTRDYLRMMDERYAPLVTADPTTTRGTGFKPYQRYKWLVERRLEPGQQDMTPGARWEAWQELRRMEQEKGTRSETWFNLGPANVAGRCLAIDVHPTNPDIVYAGFASSGIWKTTNGGTTWTALDDFLPTLAVGSIEIDVNNPDHIWIGTGEGWGNVDAVFGGGILESTDAGATWNTTGMSYPLSNSRAVFEIEHNPVTGTLMAATGHGLWRSTDGGVTYTQVMTTGDWMDVELQRGSTSVMFATCMASAENGFYRSTDDGLTWTRIVAGAPTTDIGNNRFALTDVDPNHVLFACANGGGTQKGIWRSTDGGLNFTQIFGAGNHYGPQGWYNLTIDISPVSTSTVFSGGVDFYRSGNGGTSFFQTAGNVHVDHHATAWAPSNSSHFWVGSDGGVWKSTDGGTSFLDVNTGLITMQFYAINHAETDPHLALGGTQDNGTWRYNNNVNWTYVIGGDGFFCEIDRVTPATMYGELYYGDHRRSVNGGGTFFSNNTGITEQGPWETPTWMDYSNPQIIWTAHNTKVFRTTNRMDLWVDMNMPVGLGGGRSIHQCRDVPSTVVVLGGARVWVTTDSGASWTNKTGSLATGNQLSDVYCHPTDPNTWVVTLSTFSTSTYKQVSKTTDGGTTWVAIDTGLPDEPMNAIEMDPQHPDRYFVGSDLAVYYSPDAGATWLPFNTGLPHVMIDDLRLHDSARLLRVGTHGRGMWEVDISNLGGSESVETHPRVEPLTLRVFGNPATETTTLRYGTREPGQLRLALYDLQGREVKLLLDRFNYGTIGAMEVDVRDLPAGVYFARLTAGKDEISQKLVVRH